MSSGKRKRPTVSPQANTQDLLEQETDIIHQVQNQQLRYEEEPHSHSPRKKIKIMSNSDQTPAERKCLRKQLRQMHDDILSGAAAIDDSGNEVEDEKKTAFQNMRQKNNRLWDQVKFTSEAVLESKNIGLIAAHASREAEDLITLPRYDAYRLARKLREKAVVRGTKSFGWRGFSHQVGVCYNSLPRHVSFLHGSLDTGYKEKVRKRAVRRKQVQDDDDSVEEERPIEEKMNKKKKMTGNELTAVEQHMKNTYHTLIKRSKEEEEGAKSRKGEYLASLKQELNHLDEDERDKIVAHKAKKFRSEAQKVNAIQVLFDPNSFTKTVENLSHCTHFVRENRAAFEVRSADKAKKLGLGGPGPVIRPFMGNEEEPPAPKQAIVSLNMKDWRDLCQAFEVRHSDVSHSEQMYKCDNREEESIDNEINICDEKRKRKGMPKTEGLKSDKIHDSTNPNIVTPVKSEGGQKGQMSHDAIPHHLDFSASSESKSRGNVTEKSNELHTSTLAESSRRISHESKPTCLDFACSPGSTRRRKRSEMTKRTREQPRIEDIIDLTDEPQFKPDPDGIIDLTGD